MKAGTGDKEGEKDGQKMEMKLKMGRGMEMEREMEMEQGTMYRKSNLCIPEKELRGLIPNSYIHVSVNNYTCDLFYTYKKCLTSKLQVMKNFLIME